MENSSSFSLFPNLPPELRERVWLSTIDWRCHVLPRPPIIELSVCHEARNALLRVYRPCFHHVPGFYKEDDITFSVGTSPGKRWIQIQGMGNRSPRSPYANYETDVLHLSWAMLYTVQQGDSLQTFLVKEAIENLRHVLILLQAWPPRRHGSRVRRVGAPPPESKPDSRLVLTNFHAMTTLSLADEPRVKVNIACTEPEMPIWKQIELHRMRNSYEDEVLVREKLALRESFAEGKILIPVDDPTTFTNQYFKFEEAKAWIDDKSQEFSGWSPPKVQYAMIIPDPEGR